MERGEIIETMLPLEQAALREERAPDVKQGLRLKNRIQILVHSRKLLGLLLAFALGWLVSQIPPPPLLDERAMYFLATLAAGVILWISDLFDEYIVAMLLLLVWLLSEVVPSEVALGGFSNKSWFFVLGVLGVAAAVNKTGLLYRIVLQILRRFPPDYKLYTFILTACGLLVTPLVPTGKARIAIVAPISKTICELLHFKHCSNGSAGVALSAYVGFSQMSFMFLTGTASCLVGWNLLPEPAKAEFGWGTWTLAALPAGILILFILSLAIHFLFDLKDKPVEEFLKALETQPNFSGSLTKAERLSIGILALTLVGWIGKPFHEINGAWIALGALLAFLITGVLDRNDLKDRVDWGFLLFLGIISSLDVIMRHLNVDSWLTGLVDHILSRFSLDPIPFLIVVSLVAHFVRLFLSKTATVILVSSIGLTSWAQGIGIHPGVLLLTVLIASESWFLLYQNGAYQIAYYSTDGTAFSHSQARKLMVARFFASFLALTISVPYWRILGLIQ